MFLNKNNKIFNGISILVFLTILAVIPYLGFQYIKGNVKQDLLEAMQTVNLATEQSVGLWAEEEKSVVQNWAELGNNALINNTLKLLATEQSKEKLVNNPATHLLHEHLAPLIKNKGYTDFFVIAPNFVNIASMWNENLAQKNVILEHENTLQRAFSGEVVLTTPALLDTALRDKNGQLTSQLPTMFLASPIRDKNQKIIAVLVFRIDPSQQFTHLLQRGHIGKTGETYAINKSGLLISDSRYESELKEKGILSENESGILRIAVRDPGYNLFKSKNNVEFSDLYTKPFTLMAQSLISGASASNLEGYRDYRGVYVVGVWSWNSELDIGIATEINVDDAFTTLNAIGFAVLISTAINIILVLLLIAKFMQHNRAVELQALEDGLTGLANRRMLDIKLDLEFTASVRNQQPLTVCMIDIDHFKVFNDKLGHLAGDDALHQVAQGISSVVKRKTDLVARYGGEEFCVVLPNTNLSESLAVAEKVRKAVLELNIAHHKSHTSPCLTVSIGIASLISDDESIETVLARADKALYAAKQAGRNCAKTNV